MCGIVGYIGQRGASPLLLDGLKRLEYRGYDSAGVAIMNAVNLSDGIDGLAAGVCAIAAASFAVIAFDGISLLTTRMTAEDQSATAAMNASDTWVRTHDAKQALATAQQSAATANPLNLVDAAAFRIDQDGTAHVRLTREAATLVVQHVGPLRKLCTVNVESSGRSTQ